MGATIRGSAIPNYMEDDSDVSESKQQLREIEVLSPKKHIVCSESV